MSPEYVFTASHVPRFYDSRYYGEMAIHEMQRTVMEYVMLPACLLPRVTGDPGWVPTRRLRLWARDWSSS